ncbi:aspartate/glutamate racemase family protein [Silicimonas sp. MF1-12-2]|uniref:aspartate/glutamate racemase family protein n=1 Tax=Silicimonas sp. MF1-12-2 TaxID=3384793 RepID=UPI0039B50468
MTLYVINPNSSVHVTEGIDRAVHPLRAWGHTIRCLTLAEGPAGIETDAHVAGVIDPQMRLAASLKDASGIVSACFSDPGVARMRATLRLPVIGIREAAVTQALTLGRRFGVIAIGEASVRRHLAAFRDMGLMERLAGDRPLGLSVTELSDREKTAGRMKETGRLLRDEDGADVLIMGCAGMAEYRSEIEEDTGLPVIEPCQAAVALALGRITLRLIHGEIKDA